MGTVNFNKSGLGFIGVGNMGSAMVLGLIESGFPARDITLFDIDPKKYEKFGEHQVNTAMSNAELISSTKYIFLAALPKQIKSSLCGLDRETLQGKIFISIAASVCTHDICKALGTDVPVIRIMPSMPMIVGMGAVAACRNELVCDEEFYYVINLFKSISVVSVMDEKYLNPIIAVNGSSPAFVYLFVKAMRDGALVQGITPEVSMPLILQTIKGAVKVLETKIEVDIEDLLHEVALPGGTTERALKSLDNDEFVEAIIKAMLECTAMADEISSKITL